MAGAIDLRTDVFSFCVSLFEALFGVLPFVGEFVEARRAAIAQGAITASASQTRVPVLLRGLHVDRAQRPASMAQLIQNLAPTARPRSLRALPRAIMGAVALLATAALVMTRTRPERGLVSRLILSALGMALTLLLVGGCGSRQPQVVCTGSSCPCSRDAECVLSPFERRVQTASDCYCANDSCGTAKPLRRDEAARNESSWRALCESVPHLCDRQRLCAFSPAAQAVCYRGTCAKVLLDGR
jgi:hypothetical protein